MTYEERESIMAKDIISTSKVAQLLGKSVSEASRVVAKNRDTYSKAGTLRWNARGEIATQDYCDFMKIERR